MSRVETDRREFLILIAALMACQAFAVDAMLPALPTIAAALRVTDANHMQWVIAAYTGGLGIGQLFWGVLSDRFGRRPILLAGLAAYMVAASLCGLAGSFVALLAWRFVHGLAAAAMVVSRSMVRDVYSGRQMARVMSLTFIVFLLVPIIAPSFGQLLLWFLDWRFLFITFSIFGIAVWLWVLLRLPETLHPEFRYTLTVDHVVTATRRVIADRASFWYTLAQTVIFGSVLAYVSTVQQIFETVFKRPALMPAMFALCSLVMAAGSFTNARIVERFGMRRVSQTGLLLYILAAALHIAVVMAGEESIASFVLLQSLTLAFIGFLGANFGAMAMEHMGPVAGLAAALQGSFSSVGGAIVGATVGHFFNGTTLPLAIGLLCCGSFALACVLAAERGRLFVPHQPQHAADRPR
jgi:DHA1 family bicyclomycin/chloramphenicol resistance-like MFS transporter